MPNLISAFKDLDCSTNVYWGTSAGRSQYFGDYFRGLAYVMSWPLVRLSPPLSSLPRSRSKTVFPGLGANDRTRRYRSLG
jgi:hypothetical protein